LVECQQAVLLEMRKRGEGDKGDEGAGEAGGERINN
jgi:hypothetical protein